MSRQRQRKATDAERLEILAARMLELAAEARDRGDINLAAWLKAKVTQYLSDAAFLEKAAKQQIQPKKR
jgi:hypothetical protein